MVRVSPRFQTIMASVAPSRLAWLKRVQCSIFQTAYNPKNLRTGAKYLRSRLRGPSMVNYYPPTLNIAQLARQFPELQIQFEPEKERLADLEDRKRRGKGAPKKRSRKGA